MAANKEKKKLVEETMKMKAHSAELQKFIHVESKRHRQLDAALEKCNAEIEEGEERMRTVAERGRGKSDYVQEAEKFRMKKVRGATGRSGRGVGPFRERGARGG